VQAVSDARLGTVQFELPFERPAPKPRFVRHPKARRYLIRVSEEGEVLVTVPRRGTMREAAEFAERERFWIDRQLARLAREQAALPPPTPAAELRARAVRELPARLHELAERHGLSVSRISVRNQRRLWGSCSPSGHICLNWRLVQMPPWVRDYVLIHELMHLRRMDHSPRFWKLVAAVCPRYREARAWLRAHQALLSRAPEVRTPDRNRPRISARDDSLKS
jgi:predicted metal-dependent hydrolase